MLVGTSGPSLVNFLSLNTPLGIRQVSRNWRNCLHTLSPLFHLYSVLLRRKVLTFSQLHAVSRIQQGRQRELSVKIFRPPLSSELSQHCVLGGGTKRHASLPDSGDRSRRHRTHNHRVYSRTLARPYYLIICIITQTARTSTMTGGIRCRK